MAEQFFERRIFWDRADIPKGTKALIINVKDPFFKLMAKDSPDEELILFDDKEAYVEVTEDEWLNVKDDPQKADELARQFGRLVQESLGADWHRWHDAE